MHESDDDSVAATGLRRLTVGWRGDLSAAVAGALLPLAFAPFDLFPLAILCPALLFMAVDGVKPRRALRRGFLFGLGQFGVGVSWVFVAIHEFGDTGVVLATLLTALFVAVLALYPALFGWAAAWLLRRAGTRFGAPARWLLLLPVLWLLVEWLRGWLFTGFPWLQLGYSEEHAPLAGLAPIFGVYGITWACAVSAGVLAWLLRSGRRAWPGIAAVAVLWCGAWGLRQVDWTHPTGNPVSFALIQDNLPQETKWDPSQFQRRLNLYARLTLQNIGNVDVIVWPENAITAFYGDLKSDYFDALAAKARAAGTDLVVGVPLRKKDGKGYYTTLMVLGRHDGVYRKHHLVPFGEYVPLQGVLRGLINFFNLPMSNFSPGGADQPPLLVDGQPAAMSVCYEDAFGEQLLHNFPRATLLINGSNNAWYGHSFAPPQHLEISIMRTIETGRPLVRATTNGITALVDSHGHILARAPQFRTYVLRGAVQPMAGSTPYTRWGNTPVLILAYAILGGLLWRGRHA